MELGLQQLARTVPSRSPKVMRRSLLSAKPREMLASIRDFGNMNIMNYNARMYLFDFVWIFTVSASLFDIGLCSSGMSRKH